MTGLKNLESRRNTTVLVQAAKFKRLENHQKHKRLSEPTKCRRKRTSFLCKPRGLKDKTLSCYSMWTRSHHIAHYQPEKENCSMRYETASLASIQRTHRQKQKGKQWPLTSSSKPTHEHWTHAYTNGSAEKDTENGDGGIYISLTHGTTINLAIPPGKFSTIYKAEADAFQTETKLLLEKKRGHTPQSCHLLRCFVSLAGTAEP